MRIAHMTEPGKLLYLQWFRGMGIYIFQNMIKRHSMFSTLTCLSFFCACFAGYRNQKTIDEIKSDYVKICEYLFLKLLKKEDLDRFYWPASPSTGGGFDFPNDPDRGDVHYWEVWHGNRPFTEYRKFYFRYLSEFGFQSFPSIKTVETFTLPQDRNVFSYVMENIIRELSVACG